MNIIDTLEALEAAPQGNARLEVLAAGDSPGLREVLNLALSPDITFGIRQLPEPDECERAGRDLNKHDEESWFRALIILMLIKAGRCPLYFYIAKITSPPAQRCREGRDRRTLCWQSFLSEPACTAKLRLFDR